jgi:hypothetical protein
VHPAQTANRKPQTANRKPQTATWQMPRCRDAEMPSYLQRVAGMARLLFEAALECVAVAEGLALP